MSKRAKPEKPSNTDCCGSGCTPCVFDIYEKQLLAWTENLIGDNDTTLRTDLLSETCFKPFKLIEKRYLTDDVVHLRFQAVQSDTSNDKVDEINGVLPYKAGQHIFLRCFLHAEDNKALIQQDLKSGNMLQSENYKIVTRAYTPITLSTKEKDCCFNIFVKLYKNGICSEFFRKSIVNSIMYFRGPQGGFLYKPNSFSHLLMLCIGTGLAPMMSIINTILNNETDETSIHLMFGVQNINHVILRDELRRMTQFWNFTLEYYFSQEIEQNTSVKFGEIGKNQRICLNSIEDYIIGKDLKKLKVLVCGSDSFSLAMRNNLQTLGINISSNVHIF